MARHSGLPGWRFIFEWWRYWSPTGEAHNSTPGAAPGVFFYCAGATQYGSPPGLSRGGPARWGFRGGAKQHGENALELHGKGQIIGIFRLALGRVAPPGSLKMTEFLMDTTRPWGAALPPKNLVCSPDSSWQNSEQMV